MQIWKMESYPIGDRRLPHNVFPPKPLSVEDLRNKAGVVYYKVNLADTQAMKKRLSAVKKENNVNTGDILTIDENVADLPRILEDLYEEQEADGPTVCMVIEGDMYMDVEYEEEEWLRMHMEKGDLIVVPKNKLYRYTCTPSNFFRLQRFNTNSTITI
ncbi:unnamed protein product [Bursaphelenchus okinawaensis]|uniref:ARD n=1 Tax=Bursaphelenchus okinawaensis TaxID=465554 RepID=A0A811KY38_9BILA|nr:unnamed protein product [Bursaphelenchus okinawaensis]CAG9115252.1 unnamed protein product [Bursaphelenchus okinawaensis]